MIRDQKSLYRLFALTLSILITISLINHQASKHLLLRKNHHFLQTARLTPRSTISETDHEPISLIDYSKIYYAQSTRNMRALVILSFVLWLSFLFSFVGIVASDFFCPNLSTISCRLGLSENLAGVTLLGFGNGAPDVFSTFAAIKADTGSLAIGELIGATSFIISVVVGSMSIIRPFKVPRHSFLRDLGFFIVAIVFVLIIIKEGVIHRWQANALVLLYLIYVAAVLLSTWSVGRKRIKLDQLQIARSEYNHDDQLIQPYLDDPDFPIQPNSLDVSPLIPELNQGITSFNFPTRSSPQLGPPSNQSRPPSLQMETPSSLKSQDSFKSLLETSCYPLPLPVRQRRMRAPSLSYRADNPCPPINCLGLSSPSNGNGPIHPASHSSPPPPLPNASQDLMASPEAPRRRRRNTVVINPIRPSLLGAIEFRDVVNSLARDSISHPIPRFIGHMSPQLSYSTSQGHRSRAGSIAVIPRNISSPIAPPRRHPCPIRSDSDRPIRKTEFVLPTINTSLPGRTTSRHRLTQSQSSILPTTHRPWESAKQPSPRMDNEVNPADGEESIIELPSMDQDNLLPDRADDGPPSVHPTDLTRRPSSQTPISSMQNPAAPLPSILITSDRQEVLALPDSPDQDGETPSARSLPPNLERARRRQRWWVLISVIWETLFPTLKDWRIKSLLGKAVAIVSAPAVLVLTLTLPVVDETEEDSIEELQDYEEQEDHEDDIGDALVGLDEERTVGLGVNKDPVTEEAEEDSELVSVPSRCTDRDGNSRRSRAQKTYYRQGFSEEEEHQEEGGGKAASYPMVDVSPPSNPTAGVDALRFGESLGRQVGRDSLTKSTLMGRFVDEGRIAESPQQEEGETSLLEAQMESEERESEKEWLIEEAERACYSGQHIARILATVQTFLAPTFWLVCLVDSPSEGPGEGAMMVEVGWVRMTRGTGTAIAGLLLGGLLARLVYHHLGPGHKGKVVKITLCFLGFLNSMVWILNIVNEVIQILTTFGSIFHLSDAILGLTIFGIGNSLGDFVANVTLAKMGFPVMAMSACFGGPLLNILLGIGLSSSLVMTTRGVERLSLASSKSLLVSTSALLAVLLLMLVLVPLYKHFTFDKHTGFLLILAYGAVFSLNLLVEFFL